jgi:hypothetical protein
VWYVTDYSVRSLPDTSTNQTLLQTTPHPGATQVQETCAQYIAELRTSFPGMTGTTGPTGVSASGASGASGTTAAN